MRLRAGWRTAVCGVVLLVACGDDPTAPAPLVGIFALQTIAGDSLPASYTTGAGPIIRAETLYFLPWMNEGEHPVFVRHTVLQNAGLSESTEPYTLTGVALAFPPPPCNDTLVCIWPSPVGTFIGNDLIISYGDTSFRPRIYRKIE